MIFKYTAESQTVKNMILLVESKGLKTEAKIRAFIPNISNLQDVVLECLGISSKGK